MQSSRYMNDTKEEGRAPQSITFLPYVPVLDMLSTGKDAVGCRRFDVILDHVQKP